MLDRLGVDCCFQAVRWKEKLTEGQSDPPMETPSRVNVDETQSKINGEIKRLYAAIGIEPKLPLEVNVYSSRGTDPAAAFLHRLTEKHNIADTEFLVGGIGYLTTLARRDLSARARLHRPKIHRRFSKRSLCASIASTPTGRVVTRALVAGSADPDTTATVINRTRYYMIELLLMRCSDTHF